MARLPVASTGAALAAACLLASGAARAGGDSILGETFNANDITIPKGATWSVDADKHQTTIKVHKLTIDGILSANGLGTVGIDKMSGPQPGGGAGQAGKNAPGGGAGFIGKGGAGNILVDAGVCDPAGGADGGDAWLVADGGIEGKWGAAGGGSYKDPGGNGGGHIVIYATTIELNGTIDVSGASYSHFAGFAGGGSGGILEIHAWKLQGSGKILATGGAGASKASGATVAGGGGAGGLVKLDLINKTGITPDVSGGKSENCGDTGAGEDGFVDDTPSMEVCLDVDGDGFYPPECNPGPKPADCDDSDDKVHPGAKETCDGVDNDCNGKTDEGDDICGAGKVCTAQGTCVTSGAMDGGPNDDGGAGANPDRIDFEGGCDITPAATASGFAAVFAALTGLALALRIRRRQRRR